MNQVLNPFDRIDPFDHKNFLRFQTLISQIKNKKKLIEISRLLEERLKEF
jgi:hypothetical protein